MIIRQLEAVVAQFHHDATTDAEKLHCGGNTAAVDTMTQCVLPENIVGMLQHDVALLKEMCNVPDHVPNVSKGMRGTLNGSGNPFEHCMINVDNNNIH